VIFQSDTDCEHRGRHLGFGKDALVVGFVGGDDVVGAEFLFGMEAGGFAYFAFAAAVGSGFFTKRGVRQEVQRGWVTPPEAAARGLKRRKAQGSETTIQQSLIDINVVR